MDKEQKKQQTSEDNKITDQDSSESTNQFNAGGNDSDYDGGHPGDAEPESKGHIGYEDED